MIINIGTTNEAKISTVKDLEGYYDWFIIDKLVSYKVESGVSDQPMSLEETITGAMNRAKNAYIQSSCDFSIGIESGLMPLDQANTGYLACEIVVIWDGSKHYMGMGGGFEYPKKAIERVIQHGEELNQAFKNAGFSDEFVGNKNGIIGFLTNNKLPRKDYTKQVFVYALSQIHHKDLY